MRHAACLALALAALAALLPAVATAQDVADLSGLWNVNQGATKHRPGSARFYERAGTPQRHTYNSLFVGKTVLVPTYGNATRDAAALKVYTDLGWNAVGIDARAVIKANGAIHCISMQIPK